MPYSSSSSSLGATDSVRAAGGGVVPAPRCPRARRSQRRGQRLLPGTPPPLGCGAGPSALRRKQLSTTQCPNSSFLPFNTCPWPQWLLLPGPTTLSSRRHLTISERCTWFFQAGLLFSLSWNNNNGSGSVHKKPGARQESPGVATGAASPGGLLRWQSRSSESSGDGSGLRAALSGGTGRRV